MSVKIDGMRELLNNLSKKAEEIDKATKRANTAGGKIVAEELKRNVPKSGYVGSNVQAKLSDNIVVSNNRTNKSTFESYVAVGFNKKANFRSHFQEFGTIEQQPIGYMARTVENSSREVAAEMEKAIRGVLS